MDLRLLLLIPMSLFVIYSVAFFIRNCWMLRGFKGPLAFPFIGNCYTSQVLEYMKYWATLKKTYGNSFTFFSFNNICYLVTADPLLSRRILSDTKTFVKGYAYTYCFSLVFGEGLVTSSYDKHKADKAIFGKYFIRTNLLKYVPVINELSRKAVKEMATHANEEQDIVHPLSYLYLRVFMTFAFGDTWDHERERAFTSIISNGSWVLGQWVLTGLPTWSIFPPIRKLREMKSTEWCHFAPFFEARKAALSRGELSDRDDCLTAMMNANLSIREICDHTTTMFAAGHDTTTYFSAYFCYSIAHHQDVQDKLREEILTVCGNKEDITPDDVTELKYLQRVSMEVLRLYPIIPSVARKAAEDVYIKERNITIRKGTEIIVALFLLNRDSELWENPTEFNPDRHENKTDYTTAKQGFFPFGYGARSCIGSVLAQVESSIFMCHLLRKFRVQPAVGFKPKIAAGISLTTSNGMLTRLEPL